MRFLELPAAGGEIAQVMPHVENAYVGVIQPARQLRDGHQGH
jgi:hypothetical protein